MLHSCPHVFFWEYLLQTLVHLIILSQLGPSLIAFINGSLFKHILFVSRFSKLKLTLAVMPTHLHQAGVTHILKSSPACHKSCLFIHISILQAGSNNIYQRAVPQRSNQINWHNDSENFYGDKGHGLYMDVLQWSSHAHWFTTRRQ